MKPALKESRFCEGGREIEKESEAPIYHILGCRGKLTAQAVGTEIALRNFVNTESKGWPSTRKGERERKEKSMSDPIERGRGNCA